MNEKIRSLIREQGKTHNEMEALNEKVQKEKREFDSEEQEKWDKLNDAFDELAEQRKRAERLEETASLVAAGDDGDVIRPEPRAEEGGPKNVRATPEYYRRFVDFVRYGSGGIPITEQRDLQMDSDIKGGYLIAAEKWVNDLIKAVEDQVFIRSKATKFSVPDAASLGVPTLESGPSDAEWTTEIKTGSEDTAMEFGKREMHPHPMAKRIKVSEPFLRRVGEILVKNQLAYKFAVTEEKAFLTGTGAEQPLGLFTASASGIPTGRDVSEDNTTTAITADGLISAAYALKAQYLAKAEWIFHRDAVKMIRKLKTTTSGDYVWRPGLAGDKQQTILDLPFHMSEFCPNTFTAGKYVGIVGDFSHYWIADALDMKLQRLIELYAETNQFGFIGRKETDGQPVLGEAFVRVALASS